MEVRRLAKNQFYTLLDKFNFSDALISVKDNLYEVYDAVCEGIEDVSKLTDFNDFTPINPVIIVLYIVNEFLSLARDLKLPSEEYSKFLNDDNNFSLLASIVCDKYLTNEQLNYKSIAFLNKFNPRISTLNLYLNFVLNIVAKKYENINKYDLLIKDMLKNSFYLGSCISSLLVNGFDVEAFSTWRTMHENECIIYVLANNGKDVFDAYFKHIQYSLAYRGQIPSKEKTDEIFAEIKTNMKKYELKSKDMKKYIEYGYLFAVKDKTYNVDFKLNFRDGVEAMAGLKNYSKTYELSSEVAHSSPLLIYSNRQYYNMITMINLYESFFRLEKVFSKFYEKVASKEEINRYMSLQNLYLRQLLHEYQKLNDEFQSRFLKKD